MKRQSEQEQDRPAIKLQGSGPHIPLNDRQFSSHVSGDNAQPMGPNETVRPSSGAGARTTGSGEPWRDKCRTVAAGEVPVSALQRMEPDDLHRQAEMEEGDGCENSGRQETIVSIMRNRVESQGFVWGGGTLEVLRGGFGFLRHSENCYQAGPNDIYVSPSQVRRFSLKSGSLVFGQIRAPKTGEGYSALLRVEIVDGLGPMDTSRLVAFENLVPMHPHRRIDLHSDENNLTTRVVDLLAPAGFGQRGLIVSPPRAGKTMLMQQMAQAVTRNHPDAWVIMLLIDERPEEVTDIRRNLEGPRCEILGSTFDQPAAAHAHITDLVLQKARRLVESGTDVVIFLDSLTRLARAWNSIQSDGGRTMTGGLDISAMDRPKAFFGSARETENGGSLTIFATALVETGSQMDQVIFEEFQGTGNMEIRLSRELADKRIWPSIDISSSGTRREDLIFRSGEAAVVTALRRQLLEMNDQDAVRWLLGKLESAPTNPAFLAAFERQQSNA